MSDKSSIKLTLEEASKLEGTELGEFWEWLCDFRRHRDMMSDKAFKILEKEYEFQCKYLETEFTIVEEEETHTTVYKSLNNDLDGRRIEIDRDDI